MTKTCSAFFSVLYQNEQKLNLSGQNEASVWTLTASDVHLSDLTWQHNNHQLISNVNNHHLQLADSSQRKFMRLVLTCSLAAGVSVMQQWSDVELHGDWWVSVFSQNIYFLRLLYLCLCIFYTQSYFPYKLVYMLVSTFMISVFLVLVLSCFCIRTLKEMKCVHTETDSGLLLNPAAWRDDWLFLSIKSDRTHFEWSGLVPNEQLNFESNLCTYFYFSVF